DPSLRNLEYLWDHPCAGKREARRAVVHSTISQQGSTMSEFGYSGYQRPGDGQGEFSAQTFIIGQLLSRLSTATLVRIVSCTNAGGLSPVGFVDVQPLVNQVDGANNAVPHGVVHNLPYFRLQGGDNAVIIDPKPGDIGMAAFASRDISAVKASKKQSNPGSGRAFDMADGMYFGGLLNGAPSQYVRFSAEGIKMFSPAAITLEAPTVEIVGGESVTVTTPTFTVNGATVLNGPLSQGMGEAGGAATMQGPITVTEDV